MFRSTVEVSYHMVDHSYEISVLSLCVIEIIEKLSHLVLIVSLVCRIEHVDIL